MSKYNYLWRRVLGVRGASNESAEGAEAEVAAGRGFSPPSPSLLATPVSPPFPLLSSPPPHRTARPSVSPPSSLTLTATGEYSADAYVPCTRREPSCGLVHEAPLDSVDYLFSLALSTPPVESPAACPRRLDADRVATAGDTTAESQVTSYTIWRQLRVV